MTSVDTSVLLAMFLNEPTTMDAWGWFNLKFKVQPYQYLSELAIDTGALHLLSLGTARRLG